VSDLERDRPWITKLRLLVRKPHAHAALAKIGLHQLAPRAVVLRQLAQIEHRMFYTFSFQRRLKRRDMSVDVGIVRPEGGIESRAAAC
jgi:hypothetical protein